jgi:lipopolysaccharide transport system permease protein
MSTAAGTLHDPDPLPEDRDGAPEGAAADDLPVTVLERRRGWQVVDLGELWRHRELLFFLTWRDVQVRYKQTVLGVAWAVLQPLATMVVFSLFLGPLVASRSVAGGRPYPLVVFAGLIPWTFFANAVGSASQSVVGNQNLVTKVYFPRLIIPMAAVGAGLVDFAIAFALLLVLMPCYGVAPGWGLLQVPALGLGLVIATLGAGALLAALTVAYRDFRHAVPFLIQLGMFATPAVYMPDAAIGPRWRAVLPLNPAYGLILNFRRAVLGGPIDAYALGVSGAVGVALLLAGCLYFRRVERGFADII